MIANSARVVVADTDRTVLELLQIRLELAGYRVFVCRGGDELIDMTKVARPTAMVLDLNLSGLGASVVLDQLRRKNLLNFPFLLMGKNMTPESLQEALRLGARSCIVKPFSGADVVERVNWMMRTPPQGPAPILAPISASGPPPRRPSVYLDA
ncbi:MAG TPA: response regulator [Caulobacteraceae bacterium]|nr:response regulator [Caulobacteraceae bacterium]